ncbi:MAG: sulfatase [Melioribacteraceae bacterium]|nr:sulfatase [Melioribacteraceae bacterium]
MDRRNFIKGTTAASFGAAMIPNILMPKNIKANHNSHFNSSNSAKPNILWVMAEDICPDLGCYGNHDVETPNIDKFATEGTRYTNAYTTCSICSPSRSAMITGMYQTSIGAHNHRTLDEFKKPLPDGIKPITEYLKEAGYYTVNDNPNKKGSKNKKIGFRGSGKEDFNFAYDGDVFEGTDWSDRQEGQPFFAQLTFMSTHRGPGWEKAEKFSKKVDPDKISIPPYYPDHKITREDWATYLNAIQMTDEFFGQLMNRLDEEGLSENTVVFFLADEGRAMLRAKQWLYHPGLHIPMIVRWPGKIEAGKINDKMVSGIDLTATTLQLAGIDIPSYMEGIPFLDHNIPERDYIIGARDRADATVDRVRSVHSKHFNYIRNFFPELPYTQQNRYKDTRYPVLQLMKDLHAENKLTETQQAFMAESKPEEEFYDLLADPFETNNLANDPNYSVQLEKHRKILDDWIVSTGDLGSIPESKKELDKVIEYRIEKYGF